MINFFTETTFELKQKNNISAWILSVIKNESFVLGDVNYIFCDDKYLLEKNIKYLKHNTLTDIISFDYTEGDNISGDIYISVERVEENAKELSIPFLDELHRVMVHGILHYCGYKDKLKSEINEMRSKEDYYLSLRTF